MRRRPAHRLLLPVAAACCCAPARAAAAYWWSFNDSDCLPGKNSLGVCAEDDVAGCEAACLKIKGDTPDTTCGGFNWPHKHFKAGNCAGSQTKVAGLTLYVLKDSPQPPPPPAPPPGPAPPSGKRYWWQFNQTDCLPGVEMGNCQTDNIDDCKEQCLKTDGCGGFNWPHKHLKSLTCFGNQGTQGSQPTLTLYVLGPYPQPAPYPPPPPEHKLLPHPVDDPDAKCLNGDLPSVAVWANNVTASTSWMVSISGASPGLYSCFPLSGCAQFVPYVPPGSPTPAPPPPSTGAATPNSGPQSGNCKVNPTFCEFNQAQLTTCDYGFYLGDRDVLANATGAEGKGAVNATTLHFRGQKVLAAQLAKLGKLGLSKATEVVVTGLGTAGTIAVVNADALHAAILKIAPGLKKFGVVPVDGIHPRGIAASTPWEKSVWGDRPIMSGLDMTPYPGIQMEWMDHSLQFIYEYNINSTDPSSVLNPGCVKANPGNEWKCLYANETLAHTDAPVFAIQQLNAVWENQCQFFGLQAGNILMVNCDPGAHGAQFRFAHDCTQYVDRCQPQTVKNWTVPLQQQAIDDYVGAGLSAGKKGRGGFFHSCYLGNLVPSLYNGTGQWQLLTINNVSMQKALDDWWKSLGDDDDTEPGYSTGGGPTYPNTYFDAPWNASATLGIEGVHSVEDIEYDMDHLGAPVCPAYVNHYYTNPSCRGFRTWY